MYVPQPSAAALRDLLPEWYRTDCKVRCGCYRESESGRAGDGPTTSALIVFCSCSTPGNTKQTSNDAKPFLQLTSKAVTCYKCYDVDYLSNLSMPARPDAPTGLFILTSRTMWTASMPIGIFGYDPLPGYYGLLKLHNGVHQSHSTMGNRSSGTSRSWGEVSFNR